MKTTKWPASSREFSKAIFRFLFILFASCLLSNSIAYAADVGSFVPSVSLKNLSGESVEVAVGPGSTALVVFFLDPSPEALSFFGSLNEVISPISGLSFIGIVRKNVQEVPDCLPELQAKLLHDEHKLAGVFSKEYPFVAIIGPGNILLAILDDVKNTDGILIGLCDIFLANGFPSVTESLCGSSLKSKEDGLQESLLLNYATVLYGEAETARGNLDDLLEKSPKSDELHAALGFLLYQEGEARRAMDECQRAAASGFANWVSGSILSRAGECDRAASAFDKSAKGKFLFRWQQVLSLTSAGRSAESKGEWDKALSLYKQAFELAPLNRIVLANLLVHYWALDKVANAEAYAKMLTNSNLDPLTRSLLSEYTSEREFKDSPSARERIEKKIKKGRTETRNRRSNGKVILVSDFNVLDCPMELAGVDVAAAGYLRSWLERDARFTVVARPEVMEAARVMDVPEDKVHDPAQLQRIAQALSCDLLVLAEIGAYEDSYLMNIRIANAQSGEIIAVSTERFPTYKGVAPAIDMAAANLIQTLSMK